MTQVLAHSVRRGLTFAALFAGLVLMPSASFAERSQRDQERDSSKQERVVRGGQTAAPDAAVVRPGERGQSREAPAVGAQPQRQPAAPQVRQPATPQVWSGQADQRTGVGGWRGDGAAPRADRFDSSRQPRQYAAPEGPSTSPQQPYRQPRQDVTPGVRPNPYQTYSPREGQSAGGRWSGASPRVDRSFDRGQTAGGSDARQPYRTAPAPGARGDANGAGALQRTRARDSQPDRGNAYQYQPRVQRGDQSGADAYQLYRTPRKTGTPEVAAGGLERRSGSRGDERGGMVTGGSDRGSRSDTGRDRRQEMPKITRPGAAERQRGQEQGGTAATKPSVPRGERRFAVPEARFRGPTSDERVRVVPKDEPTRVQTRMRDAIRRDSRKFGASDPRVLPGRDVVGNWIPKDTVLLNRTNIVNNNITINYTKIVNNFGAPNFGFLFAPRFFDGGHRRHHTLIFVNFFYPYYFSDPYFFGFWYGGYYPSIYSYFGWCPGWVYPTRVYYAPAEYYYYPPATPYRYYSTGYDLDYAGADRAISDIRRAWLNSDIGPLSAHFTDQLDIRVYFDGEYSYTTTTDDFYQMTLDTLATTQTVEMDFNDPIWISSHETFVTGRQVFYDLDGDRNVVYVSFRLRHLGTGWYLVAIGTSRDPIRHQYTDFRYD